MKKKIQHVKMQQLLKTRSMILVTDVLEDGLPRPGTTAQKLREYYVDKYLPKPLQNTSRADARVETQEALRIG